MGNTLGNTGGNFFDTAVYNALVPKEGPKACAITAPFSASSTSFLIDFTLTQTQNFMSLIQGVYIDNYANPDVLRITVAGSNQSITFPAQSQGYIPLLVSKPSQITVSSAGETTVTLTFLNVPVPAIIWPESSGGGGGCCEATEGPLYPATPTATNSSMIGGVIGSVSGSTGEQSVFTMDTTGNMRVIVSAQESGSPEPLQLDGSGNLKVVTFETVYTQDGSDGPVTGGTPASYSSLAGAVYNSPALTITSGQQVALQSNQYGHLYTHDYSDGPVAPGTAATTAGLAAAKYTSAGVTLTDGQQAALQMDASGYLFVHQLSSGSVAPGTAAAAANLAAGVYVSAGITLTNNQQAALQLDSSGNLKVNIVADTLNPVPTTDAADGSVAPGTAAGKSMLGGLVYTSAGITLTTGQQAALQGDNTGALYVNTKTSGPLSGGTAASMSELAAGIYNSSALTLTSGQQASLQLDSSGYLKVNLYNTNTSVSVIPLTSTSAGVTTILRLTSALATTGVVKTSGGTIYILSLYNTAASVRYLHIYNQATAPTLGTTTPIATFPVPSSGAVNLALTMPLRGTTGLAYSITTDNAAIPATAATAGDVEGSIAYA